MKALIAKIFGKKRIRVRQLELIEKHIIIYSPWPSTYGVSAGGYLVRFDVASGKWNVAWECGSYSSARNMLSYLARCLDAEVHIKECNEIVFAEEVK